MNIIKRNKVYVLTAPFYKTGGTELCHQLVYAINNLGGEAKILYKNTSDGNYLNPSFQKYVSDYDVLSNDVFENFDGIVVIPESETLFIPKFKKAKIYLWWMSVDNYFKYQNIKYIYEEKKLLRTIKYLFTGYQIKKKYLPLNQMTNVKLHLAQSKYAVNFLNSNGIYNVRYLSDFINEDYINNAKQVKNSNKENVVLYNPSKGILFTKKIIKMNPNLKFIPLQNMTNEEMSEAMSKAKIYIDFGAHPGKDRMPREAALMGCCIVTGKRGSAAFDDVSIPERYKIQDKNRNLKKISNRIIEILSNYNEANNDFSYYREIIENEKKIFYEDVKDIFIKDTYETK